MHRNHVPLNCTDRTIGDIPSHTDESCISLPAVISQLIRVTLILGGGAGTMYACVTGGAGFSSL